MAAISSVRTDVYGPPPMRVAVSNVQSPVTKVKLHSGDLWRMDGDHRWKMIVCLEGRLWITQERDVRDYEMRAGDMFIVTQPGLVLVQALEEACMQITPSLKTAPYVGNYGVFP